MSASSARQVQHPERFGRLWWLPPRGTGNGLADSGWAPVADIDPAIAAELLAELRRAGVPAHAAPLTGRPRQSRPREGSRGRQYRLWVGTSAYSRAEEVLRTRLPVLLARTRP